MTSCLQITLQVNHFGLVYVTLLLLDLLKAAAKSGPAARIVWVTSLGSQLVNPPVIGKGGILGGDKGVDEINWNDLKCVRPPSHLSMRSVWCGHDIACSLLLVLHSAFQQLLRRMSHGPGCDAEGSTWMRVTGGVTPRPRSSTS